MFGPFPIELALERARQIPGVKIVGGAVELDEAQATPPRNAPALYVLRDETGEKGLGNTGGPIQPIGVIVKLVMWVRHAGDPTKAEAAMTDFEREVRRWFFGWRPEPAYKPLTIRNSGADQALGEHRIRQLLLTTGYHQTTEPNP